MNLTAEQLEEIESMAGLFFSPEEISINLEFNDEETEYFVTAIECKNMSNPLVSSYYKGRFTTQVAMRAAIKQSAENGSNPAQQAMLKFMNDSEI